MTRRNPPEPMCWRRLQAALTKTGATEEAIAAARSGYIAGIYNGLYMLGQTTTNEDMVREWRDYFDAAAVDFREELQKFKAKHKKGGA